MTQATDAALVPDDVRALRVQNGALRTLNRCYEEEIKQHRAQAQEYHAATTTLDSEREANRILTDTIEAQARRIEALEGALRPFAKAGELFGEPLPGGYEEGIYNPAAGPEYGFGAHALRAARAALEPTP